MRKQYGWSILAAGWLLAGCGTATQGPQARSTGSGPEAPGAPTAPRNAAAPAGEPAPFDAEGESFSGESAADAAPAAPPAATGAAAASRGAADAPRAEARRSAPEKKSSRALEHDDERPGLGTTWGETMTSHVSNAPFERESSRPFTLTTLHYNDQTGISAMLRGASFADFRTEALPSASGVLGVRLVDAAGTPLPTFASGSRTLVQGETGQRYLIELENRTSSRFEAVVTVDGLDVIDGRPGNLAKRGYLVQPFATVQIDGFRQNMAQVAAFRFGSVRGSYAAQKGNDRNVGVIGVAVFAERGARPWTQRELERRESADPFPGRFAAPPVVR